MDERPAEGHAGTPPLTPLKKPGHSTGLFLTAGKCLATQPQKVASHLLLSWILIALEQRCEMDCVLRQHGNHGADSVGSFPEINEILVAHGLSHPLSHRIGGMVKPTSFIAWNISAETWWHHPRCWRLPRLRPHRRTPFALAHRFLSEIHSCVSRPVCEHRTTGQPDLVDITGPERHLSMRCRRKIQMKTMVPN